MTHKQRTHLWDRTTVTFLPLHFHKIIYNLKAIIKSSCSFADTTSSLISTQLRRGRSSEVKKKMLPVIRQHSCAGGRFLCLLCIASGLDVGLAFSMQCASVNKEVVFCPEAGIDSTATALGTSHLPTSPNVCFSRIFVRHRTVIELDSNTLFPLCLSICQTAE